MHHGSHVTATMLCDCHSKHLYGASFDDESNGRSTFSASGQAFKEKVVLTSSDGVRIVFRLGRIRSYLLIDLHFVSSGLDGQKAEQISFAVDELGVQTLWSYET